MNLQTITFLLALTILISCAPIHPNHGADKDALSYNEGRPWKANEEMLDYIRLSQMKVADFRKYNDGNYKELAKGLNENIRLLVSSCTLKGAAHDELHKWLVPYMELVQELAASTDDTLSEHLVQDIEASFEEFDVYFE